jgi:ribosomal protein L11 methyltransferase
VDQGEDTFVEGCIDDLDIDFDYAEPQDGFDAFDDSQETPILVYKYSKDKLEGLKAALLSAFGDSIESGISAIETQGWQDGWKDSFKPVYSGTFCVHPPWEIPADAEGYTLIEIEPGMAFGTGQHQTTQLCLDLMSRVHSDSDRSQMHFLDVGTGSGVLTVAAAQLGYEHLTATDIEVDAVSATQQNMARNNVTARVLQGSCLPSESSDSKYELVVANILAVVIRRIFPELADCVKPGGMLLISGILAEEVAEMRVLAEANGLLVKEEALNDDWAALLLGKNL